MNRTLPILGLVLIIALAGCTGTTGNTPTANESWQSGNQEMVKVSNAVEDEGVYRFLDKERGMVCYMYNDDGLDEQGNGLSCVPRNAVNDSAPLTTTPTKVAEAPEDEGVFVFDDETAHVNCYLYNDDGLDEQGNGLTCAP